MSSKLRAALLAALALAVAVAVVAAGTPGPRGTAAARASAPRTPVVLLIHGGAWRRVGLAAVRRMAPEARRLHGLGYRTFAVNYRAGVQAFPDVVAAYERLRRTYGARTPICAYGSSAGAHMALMLAIRRPDLACVVAQAPPTVLTGLSRGLRHDAQVAFEPLGGLEEWSPANYRLYTPTLIEQGRTDPVVPLGDSIAMHQTAPNSKLLLLAHGANKWIHTGISDTALHTSLRTERTFLRAATTRWSQQGPWRPATPSA